MVGCCIGLDSVLHVPVLCVRSHCNPRKTNTLLPHVIQLVHIVYCVYCMYSILYVHTFSIHFWIHLYIVACV